MKYKKNGQGYVIRCYAGEEIVRELTEFCARESIQSGWVWGLGAVESVVLGYFEMETKSYISEEILAHLEIVSLTGNISLLDGNPMLHLHVCLSDEEFGVLGGHLFSAVVSATAELFVSPFPGEIVRKPDTFTGLNLLDLPDKES